MDVLDHFLLPIRYQIYVKAGKIVQHFLCHINTSRESLKPAECRHIKGNEMTRLLSRCRSQPNKRPGRTETKDQILSTRINPTASVVFEEKVNNVSHLCEVNDPDVALETALRRFRHLSQACWKFGVRSRQTPNYQTHTDKPRKCGGRCGCQLIGGITAFAHYHILTALMKGRAGVQTAVGNLFRCTSLKLTVIECNWCYV